LRQFVTAALCHRTRCWPDVGSVTAVCPPEEATYVADEVMAATQALKASAAASLGEIDPALHLIESNKPPTRTSPPTSF
jgi:hypothetical protein